MPIIRDLSFADYLSHPAWSQSDLSNFKFGSPAYAKWVKGHRDQEEPTDATILGKAAHCCILTPERFDESYVVKPEGMEFRSKEAKAQRDEWIADGKTILTQAVKAQVNQVVLAFKGKKLAANALARASAIEASVIWTCRDTGLECRSRPDFWIDGDAVYDLKVSIDAEKDFDTLQHRIHRNGWANQLAGNRAALQSVGVKIPTGRLIVVAPNPPQDVRVWCVQYRENDLDFLEMDNQNTRRQVVECQRTGRWPGTPDEWQNLELPASAAFTEADLENAEEIPT